MISFIFRTILMLFLVGLVFGLFFSTRANTPPIIRSTEVRSTTEEIPDAGPAQKAGAVVDDVLHAVGKVAEKAGEGLQDATKK